MNVFCLVGMIESLPVLKETATGLKTCSVLLKVERQYANSDGIYESDYILVEVWRGLAETLCNVSREGDWISVKGRIATSKYTKNEHTYYNTTFVAEKIGFMNR